MVGLAYKLEIEFFGEEVPEKHALVIDVIIFQSSPIVVLTIGHARREHLKCWVRWGSLWVRREGTFIFQGRKK